MPSLNTLKDHQRYGKLSILLHWSMALCIATLFICGVYMTDLPKDSPLRFELTQIHKSIGILVLWLAAIRILWQLNKRQKPTPANLSVVERVISKIVHHSLYLIMIAVPMSGWVAISSSSLNIPTQLFGLVPWFDLPIPDGEQGRMIHENSSEVHEILAIVLVSLVALHIFGALKHHYLNKDMVIYRMVPRFAHSGIGYFLCLFLASVILLWLTILYSNTPQASLADSASKPAEAQNIELSTMRGGDLPESYIVSANDGEVYFIWHQPVEPYRGSFQNFTAHINLSSEIPEERLFDADIEMGSYATAHEDAAEVLGGSVWFDVKNYPMASFRSSSIHIDSDNPDHPDHYIVKGVLTIRSYSLPLEFKLATAVETESSIHLVGQFDLQRQNYGVGEQEWSDDEYIGYQVIVGFDVLAQKSLVEQDLTEQEPDDKDSP